MRTLLWLLCGAGLLVCWQAVPWAILPWLALCWFAAPLVSWLALMSRRRQLRLSLSCPATAEKNRPVSATVTAQLPLPFGRARLTACIANLTTGETRNSPLTLRQGSGTWDITSACCGCLQISASRLWVWDLFGVLPVPCPCALHALLCVMPDLLALETDPSQALTNCADGDTYTPEARGNDPTETFQVREYAPGDSLRQIHWKLSGKVGRYMVREAAKPAEHRLTIYADRAVSTPRQTDALLEAAVSLTQAFLEQGQPLRLMWSAETENFRDLSDPDQLPEAVAALLKSPPTAAPILPDLSAEGKTLYCCTQLPPEDFRREDLQILLCSELPCDDPNALCFTPETMGDTLNQWIWN